MLDGLVSTLAHCMPGRCVARTSGQAHQGELCDILTHAVDDAHILDELEGAAPEVCAPVLGTCLAGSSSCGGGAGREQHLQCAASVPRSASEAQAGAPSSPTSRKRANSLLILHHGASPPEGPCGAPHSRSDRACPQLPCWP